MSFLENAIAQEQLQIERHRHIQTMLKAFLKNMAQKMMEVCI